MFVLKNKIVIITGAGSGLGRALSAAFCEEGARVIGLGRSLDSLTQTQDSIPQPSRELFSCHQSDVGDFDQLQTTIETIVNDHGKIDYLFNNAAIYPKKNFLDETAEDFSSAININVIGVANMCKLVLPVMLKNQFGRIFNIGSWADLAPIADSAAYSASKGALHALTKAIAADITAVVGEQTMEVQVHEWIPGHLNTQMSDYTGIDPALSASWGVMLAKRENDKRHCMFDRDQEWLPPKSIKERIKSKLFFWKDSE